jgi:hypothetical protein
MHYVTVQCTYTNVNEISSIKVKYSAEKQKYLSRRNGSSISINPGGRCSDYKVKFVTKQCDLLKPSHPTSASTIAYNTKNSAIADKGGCCYARRYDGLTGARC